MQLTSFTDYGLRALIYMASLPDDRMTSISEVTDVYGVSRNHMVKNNQSVKPCWLRDGRAGKRMGDSPWQAS